jgi:hypothetical protein
MRVYTPLFVLSIIALVGCMEDKPKYVCALGGCYDPATKQSVDPDVVDPETPEEKASYLEYCELSSPKLRTDVGVYDGSEFLLRMHDEGTGDAFTYCDSNRSSDSMRCYKRDNVAGAVVYSAIPFGDVEAGYHGPTSSVLTISPDGSAIYKALSKLDYFAPTKASNVSIRTYTGTCISKGNG